MFLRRDPTARPTETTHPARAAERGPGGGGRRGRPGLASLLGGSAPPTPWPRRAGAPGLQARPTNPLPSTGTPGVGCHANPCKRIQPRLLPATSHLQSPLHAMYTIHPTIALHQLARACDPRPSCNLQSPCRPPASKADCNPSKTCISEQSPRDHPASTCKRSAQCDPAISLRSPSQRSQSCDCTASRTTLPTSSALRGNNFASATPLPQVSNHAWQARDIPPHTRGQFPVVQRAAPDLLAWRLPPRSWNNRRFTKVRFLARSLHVRRKMPDPVVPDRCV